MHTAYMWETSQKAAAWEEQKGDWKDNIKMDINEIGSMDRK